MVDSLVLAVNTAAVKNPTQYLWKEEQHLLYHSPAPVSATVELIVAPRNVRVDSFAGRAHTCSFLKSVTFVTLFSARLFL